jgi:tetratricopeptide (TPR) repeat protein
MEEKRLDKDRFAGGMYRAELADAAPAPAPPPPPPPPAAPPAALAMTAPPAPVTADRAIADESHDDVVVTGSRVRKSSNAGLEGAAQRRSAAKRARRGDWNACTVDDPNRTLGGCGKLVDPAAAGVAGRAAAHVADGLSLAWRDDLDGAIAAFDQAIAISPRLSFAYLNRGLAYGHKGELERALADLDRAVRYGPNAARTYYNRSLLRRQRGETDRAEADEASAIALDPRYEALVP